VKLETLFLKIVVVLLGVPVLALCIFAVPVLGGIAAELVPGFPLIEYLVRLDFYASAVPFYYALYQVALRKIKYCAVAIFGCHVLVLPLVYLYALADDAPGVVIAGCVVPFASVVIAVFAAVLQKLLRHAIDIKTENELTI